MANQNTLNAVSQIMEKETTKSDLSRKRRSSTVAPLQKKYPRFADRFEAIVNHPLYTVLIVFCTLWALFADDITKGWFNTSVDLYISGATVFVLAVFVFETLFLSLFRDKYLWSYFFWLDLFGAVSLVAELVPGFGNRNSLTVARAGRIARSAGSLRAGRITRLFRVFRFIRLFRAARYIRERAQMFEKKPDVSDKPSIIGMHFTDVISKRVVLGVLLIILTLPNIDYREVDESKNVSLLFLEKVIRFC